VEGTGLQDLVDRSDGKTNATGAFAQRAFLGKYLVTVSQGGKQRAREVTLTPKGTTVTVELP